MSYDSGAYIAYPAITQYSSYPLTAIHAPALTYAAAPALTYAAAPALTYAAAPALSYAAAPAAIAYTNQIATPYHYAAHVVPAEATYTAATRGSIHTAPLPGHAASQTSLNTLPAPGTY